MIAPKPCNETERLAALRRYGILDTPAEAAFADPTGLLAMICRTPIAVINFIDEGWQWFKSEIGLGVKETPLGPSICAHAILQPGLFIVSDLQQDPRFAGNPLITFEPYLRFYPAALLETPDGHALGTLCVLDHVPRELTEEQKGGLQILARQVMIQLELRRSLASQTEMLKESQQAEDKIRVLNEALMQKVEEYERVVRELERSRADLQEKVEELEKFEEAVVGRELKMIELEKDVERLRSRIS
jgi:GAF domain-containing protein